MPTATGTAVPLVQPGATEYSRYLPCPETTPGYTPWWAQWHTAERCCSAAPAAPSRRRAAAPPRAIPSAAACARPSATRLSDQQCHNTDGLHLAHPPAEWCTTPRQYPV